MAHWRKFGRRPGLGVSPGSEKLQRGAGLADGRRRSADRSTARRVVDARHWQSRGSRPELRAVVGRTAHADAGPSAHWPAPGAAGAALARAATDRRAFSQTDER